jgi:hypothetical protein
VRKDKQMGNSHCDRSRMIDTRVIVRVNVLARVNFILLLSTFDI